MRQLFPTSSIVSLEDIAPSYLAEQVPRDSKLPFVRVNMVASVDGVTRGPSGTSADLTDDTDLAMLSMLRACSDAVLVGATTVRAVTYRAPKAHDRWARLRADAGMTDRPRLVIVTRHGINLDNPCFADASHPPIVVAPRQCTKRDEMATVAEVWTMGESQVDLTDLLIRLKSENMPRVVCEGGPALLSQLSLGDMLDEWCVTTAPLWLGGGDLHLTQGIAAPFAVHCEVKRLLVSDDSYLFTQWQRRTR